MCLIAEAIQQVRDTHRECARIHNAPKQIEELNFHLAIEAEKYLRRHEGNCATCQQEQEKVSA